MSRATAASAGLAAAVSACLVLASGAAAAGPCAPVKGVSRCVFGTAGSAPGEPEPLRVGQAVQAEWWGRGSYFNAGRYSFLCHQVVFSGSVSRFAAGAPVFATPSVSFLGAAPGGACTSSIGAVQVSGQSQSWITTLSVKEPAPGQYQVTDSLRDATKTPLVISAHYDEEGVGPFTCTWSAATVSGRWTWVADEQIGGSTAHGPFKLVPGSSGPLCPASGKLETLWRFSAAPPAGGFVPLVLAIH